LIIWVSFENVLQIVSLCFILIGDKFSDCVLNDRILFGVIKYDQNRYTWEQVYLSLGLVLAVQKYSLLIFIV